MVMQQESNVVSLPVVRESSPTAKLKVVRCRVSEKTDYLLAGLSENIADALFEEMVGISEQDMLARHFNVLRTVKQGEREVRVKFQVLMDKLWRSLPTGLDESHIAVPTGPIGETIQLFADRTSNHYKVLIRETGQRLQTLCMRVVTRHPLHPELFCRAFWLALASLNLSYDDRAMLMGLFNRFVMDRYGQVLSVANRSLIELKVDTTIQPFTSSQ